ncbi:MAG: PIN domain-containing protein [Chitinivibrionales bacterium]|nr:PIN domain-containing protein [Chitinivibrionales bacterium]
MTGKRVFFDTNILIYATNDGDVTKKKRAETVLRAHAENGMVSIQVLNEFLNVLLKKQKLSRSEALAHCERMRRAFDICALDAAVHEKGIALLARHRMGVWDSMILAAAVVNDCDVLFSEDFTAGQRFEGCRIVNPFADSDFA